MVSLTPSKELVFNYDTEQKTTTEAKSTVDPIVVSLLIRNPDPDRVLFKIKTTKPSNYHVKPNSGIIPAGGSVTIQVALLEVGIKEALQITDEAKPKEDKFLVQTISTSALQCHGESIPNDVADNADIVKLKWSEVEKQAKEKKDLLPIEKSKLTCRFKKVEAGDGEAQSARVPTDSPAQAPSTSTSTTNASNSNNLTSVAKDTKRTATKSTEQPVKSAVETSSAPRQKPTPSSTATSVTRQTVEPRATGSKTVQPHGKKTPDEEHAVPSIILLFVVFLLGVIMGKFVM